MPPRSRHANRLRTAHASDRRVLLTVLNPPAAATFSREGTLLAPAGAQWNEDWRDDQYLDCLRIRVMQLHDRASGRPIHDWPPS